MQGLFETNDEISREKPSLISSFVAAPDIVSDKRYSSGLVLEFQQFTGHLIAGGNTKIVRNWDLATEKCCNSFDSKSDASLTALTSAWCYDHNSGYSGIGPDIVIAGYGNGSLRVFDFRSNTGEPVQKLNESRPSSSSRMCLKFDEHTSWIVDVSFTTYGGRHEVNLQENLGIERMKLLLILIVVFAFRLSQAVLQVASSFGIYDIHLLSAQSITRCK